MSLINDALKKTQQARATVQGEDSLTGNDGTRGDSTQPSSGSPWPWIFGIVALLVVGGLASILLLNFGSKEDAETSSPLADLVVENSLSVSPTKIEEPETSPEPVKPPESANPPEPAAIDSPPPAPESASIQDASKTPQMAGTISANPRIVELLKSITVTGLLLSDETNESKILLDGDVYSVNAIIDSQLGCRIAEIRQNAVVFTDESGVRYTKRF